ncbi:MAG: hypothetical protein H8D23_16705 [Candidatus Brocadiales bacterium]|nr:hypothetical protein [Candidatus Brocadiales bacterium]
MDSKTKQEAEQGVNIQDLPKAQQAEFEALIEPSKTELFLTIKDLVNALNSNDSERVGKSLYRASIGVTVISVDIVHGLKDHKHLLMQRIRKLSADVANPRMINFLKDTENLSYTERVKVIHEALGVEAEARTRAESEVGFD